MTNSVWRRNKKFGLLALGALEDDVAGMFTDSLKGASLRLKFSRRRIVVMKVPGQLPRASSPNADSIRFDRVSVANQFDLAQFDQVFGVPSKPSFDLLKNFRGPCAFLNLQGRSVQHFNWQDANVEHSPALILFENMIHVDDRQEVARVFVVDGNRQMVDLHALAKKISRSGRRPAGKGVQRKRRSAEEQKDSPMAKLA